MKGFHRICFITGSDNIIETAATVLESGIKWIQYREKAKTKREIFNDAMKLRVLTRQFNAMLIINDYADIALAVDADGIHLGQDDLPIKEARKIVGEKIIGISTHNLDEAIQAERQGADYIGFGSIFPTNTKVDAIVQGVTGLRKIRDAVKLPLIAIGGITTENIRDVFGAGCDGVAVSSGLLNGDIRENARRFLMFNLN